MQKYYKKGYRDSGKVFIDTNPGKKIPCRKNFSKITCSKVTYKNDLQK